MNMNVLEVLRFGVTTFNSKSVEVSGWRKYDGIIITGLLLSESRA
jgi:hypothetical protein